MQQERLHITIPLISGAVNHFVIHEQGATAYVDIPGVEDKPCYQPVRQLNEALARLWGLTPVSGRDQCFTPLEPLSVWHEWSEATLADMHGLKAVC